MPIQEFTEPKIIKNLQRIKKKLYAELSVLEINYIETDDKEEFDNSNQELEIDQLHQMIRSIDKAIYLIKKGPDVSTLLRSVKTLPSEIKPGLTKEEIDDLLDSAKFTGLKKETLDETRAAIDKHLSATPNTYPLSLNAEFTQEFLASIDDKSPDKSHSLALDEVAENEDEDHYQYREFTNRMDL